jgi:hypothetical protein
MFLSLESGMKFLGFAFSLLMIVVPGYAVTNETNHQIPSRQSFCEIGLSSGFTLQVGRFDDPSGIRSTSNGDAIAARLDTQSFMSPKNGAEVIQALEELLQNPSEISEKLWKNVVHLVLSWHLRSEYESKHVPFQPGEGPRIFALGIEILNKWTESGVLSPYHKYPLYQLLNGSLAREQLTTVYNSFQQIYQSAPESFSADEIQHLLRFARSVRMPELAAFIPVSIETN